MKSSSSASESHGRHCGCGKCFRGLGDDRGATALPVGAVVTGIAEDGQGVAFAEPATPEDRGTVFGIAATVSENRERNGIEIRFPSRPGDDVLGYIDENHHIVIHKRQCDVAKRLKANDGNHILAANWDTHGGLSFPATLHIEGFDRVGVLHQITGILSQQLNVNINRLNIETGDGLFTAEIKLSVHDVRDVQAICHDLKKIEEIEEVKRF